MVYKMSKGDLHIQIFMSNEINNESIFPMFLINTAKNVLS